MAKIYIVIFAILHLSTAQISQHVFQNLKVQTSRRIAEDITKNPVVSVTSQGFANAFAAAVNSVTWVPHAFVKALGHISLPTIPSSINTEDEIEEFIIDYTKGTFNEDANLRIYELITKYGFKVEIHEVVTKDGYELTMYRIPGNGTAVFLMHGLLGSADDFVVAGRKSGLAYMLAEAGHDVWMGNSRGNKHSRRHSHLDPHKAAFWDFSWHEIGVYDLPAMIDFVLLKTNQTSLKYVGHSQGTTAFFVMASEKPEYNKKVSLMIALSPVAFMSNARSPIVRLMSPGTSILHSFSKSLGIYEFLPDNNLIRTLKLLICGTGPLAEILCQNTLFLMSGFDVSQLNVTNLPVVLGHLPSGASVKQIAHYGQEVISEEFLKFDYGASENLKRYRQKTTPGYDLESVVTNVSLFFSESDWLAHPKDVEKLFKRLPNVVDYYKVPFEQFNHVDFILAKDVKVLINNRVLNLLASF